METKEKDADIETSIRNASDELIEFIKKHSFIDDANEFANLIDFNIYSKAIADVWLR